MKRRRIFLATCALAVSLSAAATSRQEGYDELPLGEWLGQAVAGGSTYNENAEGKVAGVGEFTVNMEFVVPQSGELTGTWTLEGNSSWNFTLYSSEANIDAGALMTHTADGPVTGNPSQFSLGVTQIESDVSATGGNNFHSSDPVGPIDLKVSGIQCNDAWGEWILSWRTDLMAAGYTPTFDGDWYAVRQEGGFSEDAVKQVLDTTQALRDQINDVMDSAPEYQGVPVVPADTVWGLIEDTVEIYNQALNLTPCDRTQFKEGGYEQYIYAIGQTLAGLAHRLLQQFDLEGQPMNGKDILELTTMLQGTGVLGASSPVDSSELKAALESDIGEVLNAPERDNGEKQAAYMAAATSGLNVPEGFDPSTIFAP
jgi:hypothetical protein